MTPIQTTALTKLRATADANMAFFERNLPEIHRRLKAEPPNSSVDISDQGDLFIRHEDGSSRAVTAEILACEERLAEFRSLKDRPQILAFHKLRYVAQNPDHGDMARYHYTNLDAEYPNRVRRHFAHYYPDNSRLRPYPEFGGNYIPLVIVIGSGLGWHLPQLLTEYRIGHLIVLENDVHAFRLSLFLHDYVLTSRIAMERGTNLTFILDNDLEAISRGLMQALRKGLPPYFIHGAAVFQASHDVETVDEIKAQVTRTLWEMFFGLGYFDDELISIQNSSENLRAGFPVYTKPNCAPDDAIAFIIGSGPSLDELMPLLREYQDRAVIFSCGTALAALVNAGIKPDFHVEKERPYLTYELVTKSAGPEFLEGVGFIGLNVVHGDVFRLFKWSGMVLKSMDTMANQLAQIGASREIILNTQPTVTNTALDFVLSAGFRKVYLLGVDMGFKSPDQQHSKATLYEQSTDDEDLNNLLAQTPESDLLVPGNFGGEVSTNNVLSVARQHLEYNIRWHPRSQVFNLNDGALIKGTEPLRAAGFECSVAPVTKAHALTAVRNAFTPHQFDMRKVRTNLLAEVDEFITQVEEVVRGPQAELKDVIAKLARLYILLREGEAETRSTSALFRGTVLHLSSFAFNAITIIKDEDEALAKAEYDFGNMLDFLHEARAEVQRVLRDF